MRNTLIALSISFGLAAGSAGAAPAPASQTTAAQEPAPTKAQKKAAKLKRRERNSDVYKGSISKQNRLIEDADNAEKDKEPTDKEGGKMTKKK